MGVLYCKAGQSTEEEMYNNESAGPALEEFLDLLGQRVRLKGFSKYRAQLDNKSRTTPTIRPGALCLTCFHLASAGRHLYLFYCPVLCSSRLHWHALALHHLQGLRADVPRVHHAALHPQQQTAGQSPLNQPPVAVTAAKLNRKRRSCLSLPQRWTVPHLK